MSKKDLERILVMDANLLYGFSGFDLTYEVVEAGDCVLDKVPVLHGVSSKDKDFTWFEECVKRAYFMPRGEVEIDPNYKQLIPYIIIRANDLIFTYERAGSEHRLTGNYSIGIGGHTNVEDLSYTGLKSILQNSATRELSEELYFGESVSYSTDLRIKLGLLRPHAFLYAGNSESFVNYVHFGVVYVINLTLDDIENVVLKEEGKKLDWMTKSELWSVSDRLEEWSRLVLDKCL